MDTPPDFTAMLQQAQAMQEKLTRAQDEVKKKTVEASAGGGMVTVVITGGFEVRSVTIDPQAIDPKDPSMLQDLIVAAFNQAVGKAQELQSHEMQSIAGGLRIPGLF